MIDIEQLSKHALPITPEQRAAIDDWRAGRAAGLSGEANNEEKSDGWRMAWAIGNVKHRVIAGDAIAVMMGGTRCKACGSVNYGYRMGCRCEGEIEWGALILPSIEGESAPFKQWQELRDAKAAGTPVINSETGVDFCLDEEKEDE